MPGTVAGHHQPVPGQSSVESGVRFQLRRPQDAVAAASFRREIPLPAASGNSRTPARTDYGDPGAGARAACRLHPGVRQFLGNLWIQRSVAFRTGRLARIRQGDAEDGRPLPKPVLARHAAEHARSADAVPGPARQQQHWSARRRIVGRVRQLEDDRARGLRGLLRQRDYRRRRDRVHHQWPAGRANIGCEIPHANRGVEYTRPQAA